MAGTRDPSLAVIGRVQTGVTQAQLRAWFDTWLRQRFPSGTEGTSAGWRRSLATRIPLNRGTTILFSVLVSAFALVLLVACANVMNMMLARGLSRQRELGVRLSLGATRARVVGSWSSRASSWRFRPPRSASRSR